MLTCGVNEKLSGKKVDMNKIHTMRDLTEVEKFIVFLIKLPLLISGHIEKII